MARSFQQQSGFRTHSTAAKCALLVFAIFGLSVAGLNGRELLAEAYAAYARENLSRQGSPEVAAAAAELALRFRPGSSVNLALLGRAEQLRRRGQEAELSYRAALKQAPADAYLWRDYALLRPVGGRYDAQLAHAVERAQALAPTGKGVHMSLGVVGLMDWPRSNPRLRSLWRKSIEFSLRHDRQEFLRYVYASSQETRMCREFLLRRGADDWCQWTANARQVCHRADLEPQVRIWCEMLGAYL